MSPSTNKSFSDRTSRSDWDIAIGIPGYALKSPRSIRTTCAESMWDRSSLTMFVFIAPPLAALSRSRSSWTGPRSRPNHAAGEAERRTVVRDSDAGNIVRNGDQNHDDCSEYEE